MLNLPSCREAARESAKFKVTQIANKFNTAMGPGGIWKFAIGTYWSMPISWNPPTLTISELPAG